MGQDLDLQHARRLRDALDGTPRVDLLAAIRTASAARKNNGWMSELWRASRGPGKLAPSEYFYYRLYDSGEAGDVSRFVGKAVQERMHRACNDTHWFAVCNDKALFYTVVRGAGLPIPETIASFDARGRSGLGLILKTRTELERFLENPAHYPMFAKPSDGMYSVGAMHMLGIENGRIALKGGDAPAVAEVADFIEQFTTEGYLFQQVMAPHPALVAAIGHALASVRLLVLWRPSGPQLESCVIKLPLPGNVADNYWRPGNMLGAVNRDTGEVERVVTGTAEALRVVTAHPQTGAALHGLGVPRWQELVALCLRAASLFPGIRTQSWDVAVTADGPLLLEFNFGGDMNLHQLAHGRGVLSRDMAAHLRECGYKGRLP